MSLTNTYRRPADKTQRVARTSIGCQDAQRSVSGKPTVAIRAGLWHSWVIRGRRNKFTKKTRDSLTLEKQKHGYRAHE